MRICFVTAHIGTKHHTMMRAVGMAPVLAAAGHAVTVIADDHEDNRQLLASALAVDCRYVSRSSVWNDIQRKSDIIRHSRFDVIHSCGLDPRTFVARGSRGGAFWVVDHVERNSALTDLSWPKRSFWRWVERRSLLHADGTIAASRYLAFLFRAMLFEKRKTRPVLWLPYAVPQSIVADIRDLQCQRVPRACKTILFAGGFYRAYGVYEIVEALSLLATQENNWQFKFLGKGPEKEGLVGAIKRVGLSDRVTFAGYLAMPEYIRALADADVFVAPMHDSEADWARCPSKLYFYIAARRPIVTAAIGENAEALGEAGFYYRPGSPQSMADTLSAALRVEHSPDRASFVGPLAEHTWEDRCARYIKWLETSLA